MIKNDDNELSDLLRHFFMTAGKKVISTVSSIGYTAAMATAALAISNTASAASAQYVPEKTTPPCVGAACEPEEKPQQSVAKETPAGGSPPDLEPVPVSNYTFRCVDGKFFAEEHGEKDAEGNPEGKCVPERSYIPNNGHCPAGAQVGQFFENENFVHPVYREDDDTDMRNQENAPRTESVLFYKPICNKAEKKAKTDPRYDPNKDKIDDSVQPDAITRERQTTTAVGTKKTQPGSEDVSAGLEQTVAAAEAPKPLTGNVCQADEQTKTDVTEILNGNVYREDVCNSTGTGYNEGEPRVECNEGYQPGGENKLECVKEELEAPKEYASSQPTTQPSSQPATQPATQPSVETPEETTVEEPTEIVVVNQRDELYAYLLGEETVENEDGTTAATEVEPGQKPFSVGMRFYGGTDFQGNLEGSERIVGRYQFSEAFKESLVPELGFHAELSLGSIQTTYKNRRSSSNEDNPRKTTTLNEEDGRTYTNREEVDTTIRTDSQVKGVLGLGVGANYQFADVNDTLKFDGEITPGVDLVLGEETQTMGTRRTTYLSRNNETFGNPVVIDNYDNPEIRKELFLSANPNIAANACARYGKESVTGDVEVSACAGPRVELNTRTMRPNLGLEASLKLHF